MVRTRFNVSTSTQNNVVDGGHIKESLTRIVHTPPFLSKVLPYFSFGRPFSQVSQVDLQYRYSLCYQFIELLLWDRVPVTVFDGDKDSLCGHYSMVWSKTLGWSSPYSSIGRKGIGYGKGLAKGLAQVVTDAKTS